MSYRITDEEYALDTIKCHIVRQNVFVLHVDEDPDIYPEIQIGDTVFKNDTYICNAISSVDQDGYVKVVVQEWRG